MEITDHKINGLNDALTIVADARNPERGNMSHAYSVQWDKPDDLVVEVREIKFQDGPIGEVGVNGVSNEALLAIVADRLRGAQAGKWSCRENAIALTKIEESLHWLHARTRARLARGVEGTSAV